jgi:hypothetical protein
MPQFRHLSFAIAITAVLLLVLASVASAHPGHHRFGPRAFDNVLIGFDDVADVLTGEPGSRDKIIGKGMGDTLSGGDKRDLIRGGYGADIINGDAGNDRLIGGPDGDEISGGLGRDLIRAGRGDDTVNAVDGRRDWVRCGPGDDTVTADKVAATATHRAWRDRVADNCAIVHWVTAP